MKYIIIDLIEVATPFIFPDSIDHREVAKRFPCFDVISAGFIRHEMRGFVCYGDSVSLNVKSRGDTDAYLIERYFGIERGDVFP